MTGSVSILILGRHSGMMQNVISFLNSNGFDKAKGVLTNEEVKTELLTHQYQVVIIGGGVDGETRQMIKQLISDKNSNTKVVEHFGNPASLLEEIKILT
ncbi:MAG: hypothetical protein K2X48_11230 [Chitinophagaceae bacterium]|nr:hypothetical protein [Chitinophagaceae bacterium]